MKASEVVTAIQNAAKADVPLFLWGPPGCAKTSLVHLAAELCGVNIPDYRLIVLRVNLMEPVDFNGYPYPVDNMMRFLRPEFMPQEGTRGMIFMDELAQSPIGTQCAAMKAIDHLPSGWSAVAASNRSTDRAGAGQVATHVLSRFTHIEVDVSREEWQHWASKSGIRPEVRAFIDFRPGLLFQFDAAEVQKQRANCSPRSWHRVSRILSSADDTVLLSLLTGTVGEGAAAEFYSFLRIFRECPNPDVILGDPENTLIPREPSALFAVCAALADRARTLDMAGMKNLVTYLARLPVEFGALLITDVLGINPQVLALPNAMAWVSKHKECIASPRK